MIDKLNKGNAIGLVLVCETQTKVLFSLLTIIIDPAPLRGPADPGLERLRNFSIGQIESARDEIIDAEIRRRLFAEKSGAGTEWRGGRGEEEEEGKARHDGGGGALWIGTIFHH